MSAGQTLTALGLGDQQTTVVVQLAGDPVTVADANSAGGLSDSQKQSIRDQLRSQQAPVESQVRSHGGQVLASYQATYNGFKVQIAASQAAQLASLPGVVAVHPLQLMTPSNIHGIPLIGAPQVWDGLNGLHGDGIKIADIDTGIDYTHADFGGPGTSAAYQLALASDTMTPDLTMVGPNAPKVKGGIDLVGDAYDASGTTPAQTTPVPDPNPLDCNSHGTHTAGTMAGFGVLANGTTYAGPYNATTVSSNSWLVGPGVAPKADIYAVKIFGCSGSTSETIDGIEWAVDHNMDVINMSLGSPFGSPDDPAAVAASNAAHDGVIVVASSGNEGANAYMTSTPASGDNVISVAASDPTAGFSAASIAMSSGTATVTESNNATFSDGLSGPIYVMPTDPSSDSNDTGSIGLGCNPADYLNAPVGSIVVVQRLSTDVTGCTRNDRAIFAENANRGIKAVVLVNDLDGYPPQTGDIPNPSTGMSVQIPYFGALNSDGPAFLAADGTGGTVSHTSVSNPQFEMLAGFSSWGPRSGDSFLKPNLTAPGVNIASAGMGTGTGALVDSGTSMAAPHVTGTAALVKQAHPDWRKVKYWDAAIENTADPSQVAGYGTPPAGTRGAGTGLVQALPAVQTQVVALGSNDMGVVNFGFNELTRDFNDSEDVKLTNFGNSWATFNVADTFDQGSPHSVSLYGSTVSVPPHGDRTIRVRLSVPAATAGGASYPGLSAFSDVAGVLQFTPVSGSNNNVTLRVPYYMVPQAAANIQTRVDDRKINRTNTATAVTTNYRGAAAGSADWYAWGIKDSRDHGLQSNDLKAVGVSSFPTAAGFYGTGVLQFAIATNHRWSNAAQDVFDVLLDVNSDGTPDYDVEAADLGALTTGQFNGVDVVAVFNLHNGNANLDFYTDSPTDSSTLVMPVDWALLCDPGWPCLATSSKVTYSVRALSLTDGTRDTSDTSATFNPNSPAVSNGMFDVVNPNGSASETLTVDPAQQALTPALGWMVVSHENTSREEAQLIPLNLGHGGDHH